jgi:hypothetical protein
LFEFNRKKIIYYKHKYLPSFFHFLIYLHSDCNIFNNIKKLVSLKAHSFCHLLTSFCLPIAIFLSYCYIYYLQSTLFLSTCRYLPITIFDKYNSFSKVPFSTIFLFIFVFRLQSFYHLHISFYLPIDTFKIIWKFV